MESSRTWGTTRGQILLGVLLLLPVWPEPGGSGARRFSGRLDERVAAQKAIEEVYWRHRSWPESNRTAKPPLSSVMSEVEIQAKVEDYLRQSAALERYWSRPITGEQLQAELDRLTSSTRNEAMLRELFEALGDDPLRIAETLARQTLVDRLIRSWYAYDERFHANVRREAEQAVARAEGVAAMQAMGGDYLETTLRLRDEPDIAPGESRTDATLELGPDEWSDVMAELGRTFGAPAEAIPVGQLSELQEDEAAFFVTAVLSRADDQVVVAQVTWPKRTFDSWWSAERDALDVELAVEARPFSIAAPSATSACTNDAWQRRFYVPSARRADSGSLVWTGSEMIVWGGGRGATELDTGGRYNPATHTWVPTSTGANVPSPKRWHTSVWTGTEMIVWGGFSRSSGSVRRSNTGGRYDPVSDTWRPTSTVEAPQARYGHTAVWTGTEMIVWGGEGSLDTGGRYDPAIDVWKPTSLVGVPHGRGLHTAVWTGTEMIVWGGRSPSGSGSGFQFHATGGRYDPSIDTWTPISTAAAPEPGNTHTAVWTGSEMIVWGGGLLVALNTGGRYDPRTDAWTRTAVSPNVMGRVEHTAVWTGSRMIVWGGYTEGGVFSDTGSIYDPVSDAWQPMPELNAPDGRKDHGAVWTGTEMIVWGGYNWSGSLNSGGSYDPVTRTWTQTSMGAPTHARSLHTALWTGAEMIVWGGRSTGRLGSLNSGGRYDPATNDWKATSVESSVPEGRSSHTAVWTGTEMIAWGGLTYRGSQRVVLDTGARYDPIRDSWTPTSTGWDAPKERYGHTAVWTGKEMIVWGGSTNSGGRYDPATDSWAAASTGDGVPEERYDHTAVWTGKEMIVWGGRIRVPPTWTNTGGRYDPRTDVWTSTSVGDEVPEGRRYHSAVWTGTEMLVWGGQALRSGASALLNTGGSYNPWKDTWRSTITGPEAPAPRWLHSAVWTGSEMVVWGGEREEAQMVDTMIGLYRVCPSTDFAASVDRVSPALGRTRTPPSDTRSRGNALDRGSSIP